MAVSNCASPSTSVTAPYSAQSAGPAPWHVFRLEFDAVTALKLEEHGGAMRWRFSGKDREVIQQ